ncbi:hypothetical protein [Parachlamydia acanthamoebae]|uniref:hypothetical protein n=1 Tax=Parachlamydia acanthamoebae TaxID=83552 RepID=UPI0007513F5B|nr:hypothetical protein [Parachlamydia acanthamoebae]
MNLYTQFLSSNSSEITKLWESTCGDTIKIDKNTLSKLNLIIAKLGFAVQVDPETEDKQKFKLRERIKELNLDEESCKKIHKYKSDLSKMAFHFARKATHGNPNATYTPFNRPTY